MIWYKKSRSTFLIFFLNPSKLRLNHSKKRGTSIDFSQSPFLCGIVTTVGSPHQWVVTIDRWPPRCVARARTRSAMPPCLRARTGLAMHAAARKPHMWITFVRGASVGLRTGEIGRKKREEHRARHVGLHMGKREEDRGNKNSMDR